VPHASSRSQWLLIGRSDAPPNSRAREDTVEDGEGAVEDGDDASVDEGLAG
jgi:hypothetical protein